MKFTADSYYLIGHMHTTASKPCQDYALHQIHNNNAFVIVSDGCSNGRFTDVGSRIIAHTTAQSLQTMSTELHFDQPKWVKDIRIERVSHARISLGLIWDDLLATCIYAFIQPKGGFIRIEGDGVVALKYIDGSLKIYRYIWANETPFYPQYEQSPAGFIQCHGGDLYSEKFTIETWLKKPGTQFEHVESCELSLEKAMQGITCRIDEDELMNINYVAIFTDGVTQIDGLDWKQSVDDLLAFKTSAGEFAKRRMNRVVKDACKFGLGPLDDLSYGVIKINHEKMEE